jgi:hypothetical protein
MAMIKTANIVQEWIDEGIQQGIQRGGRENTQESIREVLEGRFHLIPDELVQSIRQVDDLATLHKLLKKAAVVSSLEEFTMEMAFGNYILQNSISIFGGGQIQILTMSV